MIEGTDIAAVPPSQSQARSARQSRWVRRPSAALGRVSPDQWAFLAIAAAVLLANMPYLLGFFDPNPLDFRSGLGNVTTPGVLSGKPWIDPSYAFLSQPLGHLAALDLLHLRLPWWNPYEGSGMPLLGETEAAALFPPTLLTALSNGQLYEHVLLELVAGVCTYLLLRRLRVARPAAVAGAIAFALGGKFAWFADATVNPLPFLPMLLLGIERAYSATREGRAGGWRVIALAGALSVYAGFPEVAYPDTLLALCWLGWRCGCLERRAIGPLLAKAALGGVAGALLAAPMLLAMGGDLFHADLGVHAGVRLSTAHIGHAGLPQLLLPYVYGQINADPHAATWITVGGYVSTTLLLFAGLGVLAAGRRGLKLVLLGWTLLVFARMYGVPPLLGHVIGVLPGMSKIEFYRYATGTLALPLIVLAALGLDDVCRVPAHRRRLLWGALAAMAVVIAAALYARPVVHSLGPKLHHDAYFRASVAWGAAVVAVAGAVTLVRSPRARAIVLALVVAVDAVVLFAVPEFAASRAATLDAAPVAYLRQHLGEARFATLGPIEPDYGSYFGLGSVNVNDFPPKLYARYVRTRLDPGVAFTGFRSTRVPSAQWELLHHLRGYRSAGVLYVLSRPGDPLPTSSTTLQLVFRSPAARIYRLVGASPYFSAAGCQVTSSGRESARVVCPTPTTLIRRETWFAGWSARLDGHATAIRIADGLFQAVTVPAGSHRIAFSFAPPGMNWALLGLLAGCVLMLSPTVRARRIPRPSVARGVT